MSDPWTWKMQKQTWLQCHRTICCFQRMLWNLIYLHRLEVISCSRTRLPSRTFPRAGRMATSHPTFQYCLIKFPWLSHWTEPCHIPNSPESMPSPRGRMPGLSVLPVPTNMSVQEGRLWHAEEIEIWGGSDLSPMRADDGAKMISPFQQKPADGP